MQGSVQPARQHPRKGNNCMYENAVCALIALRAWENPISRGWPRGGSHAAAVRTELLSNLDITTDQERYPELDQAARASYVNSALHSVVREQSDSMDCFQHALGSVACYAVEKAQEQAAK